MRGALSGGQTVKWHRGAPTPLGVVGRGALAGAAGVISMDATSYLRYLRGGGKDGPLAWELSDVDSWDQVSAPGEVAKRAIEGVFQVEVPAEVAGPLSNAVHWAYGMAWGGLYGLVVGSTSRARPFYGLALGAGVWSMSYVVLPSAKIYRPIWEYDVRSLWKDLMLHLAYGLGVGAAFRGLKWPLTR